MRILSIGNSFSQDAHAYLHKLALFNGLDISASNLFIGGCSLEHHIECLNSGRSEYDLEINGVRQRKISLKEALTADNYDFITLQQASYLSGVPQSYFPYLSELIGFCKTANPKASLLFHETWSYESDYKNDGFKKYNNDNGEMFRRIHDCALTVNKIYGLPVIPVGSVIQNIRETIPEFNYLGGGMSLCRDGLHLSLDYGRLIASAVWVKFLSGKPVDIKGFIDADESIIDKISNLISNYQE